MNYLNKTQLLEKAPALFETGRADRLSHIYKQHNGEIIMDLMEDLNWHPVKAVQASTNSRTPESEKNFKKTLVTFENPDVKLESLSGIKANIMFSTSLDGYNANNFMFGCTKELCANELYYAESVFDNLRVVHKNGAMEGFIERVHEYVRSLPNIAGQIGEYQTTRLSWTDAQLFARQSLELKYGDYAKSPVEAVQVLAPMHGERTDNLWDVFNIVQEHLTQGGDRSRMDNGRWRSTKELKNINKRVGLNKDLWLLMTAFASRLK